MSRNRYPDASTYDAVEALAEAMDAATLAREAAMRSDFAPYIEDDGTATAAAALAVLESNGWHLSREPEVARSKDEK